MSSWFWFSLKKVAIPEVAVEDTVADMTIAVGSSFIAFYE
jgi:hypothetical protein